MPVETKSARNEKAKKLRSGKLIHLLPLHKLEDDKHKTIKGNEEEITQFEATAENTQTVKTPKKTKGTD